MGASLTEYRWLWPSALAADPAGPVPSRRSTRDWLVDTLCFVLGFGSTVLLAAELVDPHPTVLQEWVGTPFWLVAVDAVLGVIAGVALWWRRRFLTWLALYLLALAFFSITSGITLLIVVFTVAVHRRFSILAAYVVAVCGVNTVFAAVRAEPAGAGFWENLWWGNFMVLVAALWGMLVRSRRQLIVSWRERAERAEAEQRLRIAQARVLERTRIAREMHDVLAHRISLLSLHAGALEFRPGAPPEEIAAASAVVRSSAHQALQDLREVIGVLRTTQSDEEEAPERPQPTLSALPALADESRSAGIRVRLNVTAEPDSVPVATGRAAYRIIQEGLTNARKHAPGVAVSVAVRGGAGEGLTVEVRNPMPVSVPDTAAAGAAGLGRRPGATGPAIPGTGMGLIGLAERATLAGGRLAHGRHGNEFVLSAWLPWPS
ncbi:putative two-component system sensor kinase [Actinoplanes missouriensis 431]|uniref:histidine kinase n=1 Tax=Actinoplanes missouriensis (strain ATCC 14538 / DSM 43046 / CBS 188.64 / JCM 3121 / NBRC 102363 / NCIMB 12654 / NRRL B-3342 / UNCC 431) TaxID=512565 RepID=I0HAW5_ACTM4|nr:histidine kinase [Actinoplanes missouriensis]BAL90152.1 putative two-component system sensor kinase [Actinoplanes missouriensis 431]